jgi:cell surface protein SprA
MKYGKPSFSQIRRYQVGVRNVGQTPITSAAVWFNELRLGQVRRDLGISARTSASVNLGDFASLSAGFNSTDADF